MSEENDFYSLNDSIEFGITYLDLLHEKSSEISDSFYGIYNIDDIKDKIDITYGSDFIDFSVKGNTIGLIKFSVNSKDAHVNFTGNVNIDNISDLNSELVDEYLDVFGDLYNSLSIKGLGKYMYKTFYKYLKENGIKLVSGNEYSDKIGKINDFMLANNVLSDIIYHGNMSIRHINHN